MGYLRAANSCAADHIANAAGTANGECVRQWFRAKKAGWYAVLADPHMPVTSLLLNQVHNAIDRKLFIQRRAQHAGQCGWKSKEEKSQHETGCSISKSSLLEAFNEL